VRDVISLRRWRTVLISAVVVVLVATGLVIAFEPEESTVDATTSSAPEARPPKEPPTSFKRAWSRPLRWTYAQLAVDDGYIAVMEQTGVRVYELLTGRERWHYLDSSLYLYSITAGGGMLLMVSSPQDPGYRVQAFDLDTGEVRATVPIPDGVEPDVVAYDEFFLIHSGTYRMYSLDGGELWSRAPESCAEGVRPDTMVYASTGGPLVLATSCEPSDGPYKIHLVGVSPENGHVLWRQEMSNVASLTDPALPASDVLPANAPILLRSPAQNAANPRSDRIVAVDPASGRRLTDGPRPPMAEEPTSVPGGWCVYLREPEDRMSCYDTATGTEWRPAVPLPDEAVATVRTVHIFPVADGAAVGTTTRDGLVVSWSGDQSLGVVPSRDRSTAQYYGPGALVATHRRDDGRTELTVYGSAAE
jgi:hypothetical protein